MLQAVKSVIRVDCNRRENIFKLVNITLKKPEDKPESPLYLVACYLNLYHHHHHYQDKIAQENNVVRTLVM